MDQTVAITVPSWFCGVLSLSLIGLVFYLGDLHCRVKEMCKDHPKIQTALTRISEILLQKNHAKDLIYANSPVKLTQDGEQAIQESGFETFYELNKKFLIKEIKERNPKSAADLEEDCKNLMLTIEDTLSGFDSLKNYAYNNGEPISHILFAGAVVLRDKLKKELGIED